MTDSNTEQYPVAVSHGTKHTGDAQTEWVFQWRTQWRWTESSVWTERMLAALETGVKGGTWERLL